MSATLAQFEERAPNERTMLNLMTSLERVAYEHKEKKGEKTKMTAAAAHNKKENEQCRYCKKMGHYKAECKKRIADEKRGVPGAAMGYGGGGGGGRGAAGQRARAETPGDRGDAGHSPLRRAVSPRLPPGVLGRAGGRPSVVRCGGF